MKGRIPRLHTDCSYCITPESYGNPAGPCSDHRGPDGQPVPYDGSDVYDPSTWVREVVGQRYTSGNWGSDAPRHIVWVCFAYDPRHGFWMRRVDDHTKTTNISGRAIDRTFHRVAMTCGAWKLLGMIDKLGRLPTDAEADHVIVAMARETLQRNGFATADCALTDLGLSALSAHMKHEDDGG